MFSAVKTAGVVIAMSSLTACATTSFNSTWKAPDAQRVDNFAGKKVIGFVLTKNEAARRSAEDALARELSARGAQGVPGYTVVPADVTDEARAKALVEKSGAVGVVVLRPVGKDKEVYSTTTMYTRPYYGGFWGGYYGYGWGGAWGGTEIRTNTIVTVETLVYSLTQNKLIWAGQSQTTNPSKVDAFVHEIVAQAGKEMKKAGLI